MWPTSQLCRASISICDGNEAITEHNRIGISVASFTYIYLGIVCAHKQLSITDESQRRKSLIITEPNIRFSICDVIARNEFPLQLHSSPHINPPHLNTYKTYRVLLYIIMREWWIPESIYSYAFRSAGCCSDITQHRGGWPRRTMFDWFAFMICPSAASQFTVSMSLTHEPRKLPRAAGTIAWLRCLCFFALYFIGICTLAKSRSDLSRV